MKFSVSNTFLDDDIHFLRVGLSKNAYKHGFHNNPESFTFILTDEDKDKKVGGISGYTYYGSFYISQFFIEDAYQKKGWGTKLMNLLEQKAIELDCKMLILQTMSWEAKGFYYYMGFKELVKIDGFDNDSSMSMMRKILNPPD